MSYVVSFTDYVPAARYDDNPWTEIKIEESADGAATWTLIDTLTITPVDPDPSRPMSRSFTTEKAEFATAWYRISFVDAAGNTDVLEPVLNGQTTEIYCTLNDINAWLDGQIVQATADNTVLLQVSMARWVRGYLGNVVDPVTLYGWSSPSTTPDIIREATGMLIAAQLYFDEMSRTSIIVEDMAYAQKLYNRAIALLNDIILGKVPIYVLNGTGGNTPTQIPTTPQDEIETTDFFPVDDTDRAFKLSMPT